MISLKLGQCREAKRLNPALIKDISQKQGIMNKYLMRLKNRGEFVWKMDYQFGPMGDGVKDFEDLNLIEEEKEYKNIGPKLTNEK